MPDATTPPADLLPPGTTTDRGLCARLAPPRTGDSAPAWHHHGPPVAPLAAWHHHGPPVAPLAAWHHHGPPVAPLAARHHHGPPVAPLAA